MVDEAALDLNQDGDDLAAGDTVGSNPGSTDETVTGTLDATDPEGDALTYTAETIVGTYGTIQINADGTYTYTLTTNSLAHTSQGTGVDGVTDSFTYTVMDDNGNSSTATITVSIKDDVPTAVDDTAATIEGGPAVGGNVITGEDGLPRHYGRRRSAQYGRCG
jgi:VCBS repeat-containing protein